MKVALNIDQRQLISNQCLNYSSLLPAINASKRDAEILFFTHKLKNQKELEKLTKLLDLIPGKASLVLGRPKADIYLGV